MLVMYGMQSMQVVHSLCLQESEGAGCRGQVARFRSGKKSECMCMALTHILDIDILDTSISATSQQ